MKKRRVISIGLILFCVGCTFPATSSGQTADLPSASSSGEGAASSSSIALPPPADPGSVISPAELEYMGAFRLPDDSGESTWEYSGRGLTYYPQGDAGGADDGFPGSLFGVGNDQQEFVSEITIPKPIISRNVEELNTAETLQPFVDITKGMFGETEIPRLGIQYLPPLPGQDSGRLHFVHGQHFQYFEASHGWSGLDLENSNPSGPWFFDGYTNYITSDYVFEIPESWSIYLPGNPRLVTGRFREGVWGGQGPALFAYDPIAEGNELPANGEIRHIVPLLLYGIQEAGVPEITSDESMQMLNYNEDDSWWAGAWLTSGERSAVIFVGTKAIGKSWYGFANGVEWEYDCAEKNPPTCPEVPEWPYENRGYWAEDYAPQIIFFNPADLVAVASGNIQTWEPQPYAALDLSEFFFNPIISLQDYKFEIAGAVAYDRQRGYLFIIERLADGYKSIIHVWKVN